MADQQPGGPVRVQLRRAKGWRMPPNTVKVDRSTKWGNPFVTSLHGDQATCVQLFEYLLGGLLCLSTNNIERQQQYLVMARRDRGELKGKNLACWCALDKPCHADVLLRLNAEAQAQARQGRSPGAPS